jgi:hypothetical protein
LQHPSNIVNIHPQNAINIIPVTNNPVVQSSTLEIKKIQPLYNENFMPNGQSHFRTNIIGNFGHKTLHQRNIKFIEFI